ncbi:MAG: hypothetical protein ACTSX7_08235, partial [Alphaproteobacteria bacterium]
RWHLQLRRGKGFRCQYAAFRKLMSGEALGTELALYRVRANGGDGRTGMAEKAPGGGSKVYTRVMAKIVCWLPRREHAELNGALVVNTEPDALLVAIDGEDRIWTYHADHMRRWVAQHAKRLQHLNDDRKAERRRPRRRGLQMQDHLDKLTARQHRRLDTLIHQVSASLANYAARRRVGKIDYCDTDTSFVGSFPWERLRSACEEKCRALGIEFNHEDGKEKNDRATARPKRR